MKVKQSLLKKLLLIFTAALMVFSVFGITFTQHIRSASAADGFNFSNDWATKTNARAARHISDPFWQFYGFSGEEVEYLTYTGSPINTAGEYFEVLFRFSDSLFEEGDLFGISFARSPIDTSSRLHIVFKFEDDTLCIGFQNSVSSYLNNGSPAYSYNENGTKNYNIGGKINGEEYKYIKLKTTLINDQVLAYNGYIDFKFYYGHEETKIVVDTKYPSSLSEEGKYRYREYDYDEGYERSQEIFVPSSSIDNVGVLRKNTTFGQFWSATNNVQSRVEIQFKAGTFEYDYSSLTKEVAELRQQLDVKDSQITALQATIATLRERELQLTESINTLDTRIAALQSDYQANIDEIVALRAEKIALEKQLSVVNEETVRYASQLTLKTQELEALTIQLAGQEEEHTAEKGFFEVVGDWISDNVLYTVLIGVGVVLIIAAAIAIPIIVKKKRS